MNLIQHLNQDFLIAYKPHNLPTVPLKNQNAETLLSCVAQLYPEVLTIHGKNEWEGSALHRLDTPTAGLVVFARTQAFYDALSALQKKDLFKKTYKAITEPVKSQIETSLTTYFRAFGPKGKSVKVCLTPDKADTPKQYTTTLKTVEINPENAVFECIITQGFRHQIRAHLAYLGCPIKGDDLYNPDAEKEDLALECTGLEFPLSNTEVFSYKVQ